MRLVDKIQLQLRDTETQQYIFKWIILVMQRWCRQVRYQGKEFHWQDTGAQAGATEMESELMSPQCSDTSVPALVESVNNITAYFCSCVLHSLF